MQDKTKCDLERVAKYEQGRSNFYDKTKQSS